MNIRPRAVALLPLLAACASPPVEPAPPPVPPEAQLPAPTRSSRAELEETSILLVLTPEGEILHAGERLSLDRVSTVVAQRLAAQELPVVVETDRETPAAMLVRVIDEAKLGGASKVSVAVPQRERR